MAIFVGCSQTTTEVASNGQQPGVTTEDVATEDSSYPEKPIELIVPYPPGANTDTVARLFAKHVSKYLPNQQPVVPRNVDGGSGSIAMTELLRANPDGYTLGWGTNGMLAILPHHESIPYTHDSFQPIVRLINLPQMLVVRADSPFPTFETWLEYTKKNPGKFKYATTGVGNLQHLLMAEVDLKLGIQTTVVPYRGSAAATQGLLSGEVDGQITFPATLDPDQIAIIFTPSQERNERFPDVPTLRELGVEIEGSGGSHGGVFAPPGITKEKVEILHKAFKQVLEDPELIESITEFGYEFVYAGPDDFQKAITDEFYSSRKIMEATGLLQ